MTTSFAPTASVHHRMLVSTALTAVVVAVAYQLATPKHHQLLVDFWCNDIPPMNDLLRITFYTALLLLALTSPYARPHLGDSPLQAPELYDYTLPQWFSLEGAMKYVPSAAISSKLIHTARNITLAAWLCCIVGFGGPYSGILVGMGMLYLHGVVAGCIGTSHRWYVPVYTTLALACSNGSGYYSVDYHLAQLLGNTTYPFAPPTTASLLTSGFGRKIALTSGIATLLFGGTSKLLNSGLRWCNGEVLAYYVSSEENGRFHWLKRFMWRQPLFTSALAMQSELFELASILAVFVKSTRLVIVGMAINLHFGIWLTMWPNYAPSCLCYLLGLDWQPYETNRHSTPLTSATLLASWSITTICIFLCFCAVFRVEHWPLSGIPMYSFYRDKSYNYKYMSGVKQAKHLADEFANSGYPNTLAWSNQWIQVMLIDVQDPQNSPIDLRQYMCNRQLKHGVVNKQWRRTCHNVAARDIAHKSEAELTAGTIAAALDKQSPAQRWLNDRLPVMRRLIAESDQPLATWCDQRGEVQMQTITKAQPIILARASWNEKQAAKHAKTVSG